MPCSAQNPISGVDTVISPKQTIPSSITAGTTGKAVVVVIMKLLQQMDTSFQISECIHHCVKRRNITIEHILHGFVIRSQR